MSGKKEVTVATTSPNENEESFDPVEKSIGTIGRWQIWIMLTIFLSKIPTPWNMLNIVFLAPPMEFACIDNATDKCSDECSEHVFNRSIFTETIISQWDLVCDKAQLANFAQTITMFGILISAITFGHFSDRFGRRIPFVAAVILQFVSGVLTAYVPWFWLFLVLRFLSAFATGGTMVVSFVLVVEILGGKWRSIMGVVYQIPFSLGHLSLVGIAYLLRDWKHLQIAISAPSVILISYYWLIPESPRWLMATGKTERAIAILKRAAKINGLPTDHIADNVNKKFSSKNNLTVNQQRNSGNLLDLFRTPTLRLRTICVSFNWFTCGFYFFGVNQYLGHIGGDIFMNVAISALVQLPGLILCLYLIQACPRKFVLCGTNVIAGSVYFLTLLIPEDSVLPRVLLGATGICAIAIYCTSLYIYSGELFPTVVRNVGIGTTSVFARLGAMIAPFVSGLKHVNFWLVPVIFGVVPIISAIVALNLPETLNCQLPDTIEEAESFGTKKRNNALHGIDNTAF